MQKWTGTFAWNDRCKPSYCCCYAGTLTVVESGSDLIFTSDTRGCGQSRSSFTFRKPNDYSFSTTGSRGSPITYILSSDGNSLTVRNNRYSSCDGSARRTSAAIHLYPSIISLIVLCTFTWIML